MSRAEILKHNVEVVKDKENWKKIQEKTFTNWFNDRLRGHLRVAKRQVSVEMWVDQDFKIGEATLRCCVL